MGRVLTRAPFLLSPNDLVNRRKSVMGNGPWSGRRSERVMGESFGKSSGNVSAWLRAFAAMAALLLAGWVLLGSSSRSAVKAQLPPAPLPAVSRASLHSRPQFSTPLHSRPEHSNLDARAILGQLPLIFEPNQGQTGPQVTFLARGAGYSLFLDATDAVLAMQTAHSAAGQEQLVRMKLVDANAGATNSETNPLPGKSNYIV